jgi:hypothetical protein
MANTLQQLAPTAQTKNPLTSAAGGGYFGYKVRGKLFDGEDDYFRKNQHVSGMASEDGQIIFNPYSKGVDFDSGGRNEAARLWMRESQVMPSFGLTGEQRAAFRGTAYEQDDNALRQTILARIISGDPSAGKITDEQRQWAEWALRNLSKRGTP